MALPQRLRSFIGTILIIVLVLVYAILAVAFASALLAETPVWVNLLYFFVSGLVWILPAMLIIRWMAGPKPRA